MTPIEWREMEPLFTQAEFTCRCGCGRGPEEMDSVFMHQLYTLRVMCNFPFIIGRGFSCPAHNAEVSKTGANGPHTTGRAADVVMYGPRAFQLVQRALDVSMFSFGGIGLRQAGDYAKRIVHLDDLPNAEGCPRPRVWTY